MKETERSHNPKGKEPITAWIDREVVARWRKSGRVVRLGPIFEEALDRALRGMGK